MPSVLTHSDNDVVALLVAAVFVLPFTDDIDLVSGSQLTFQTSDGATSTTLSQIVEALSREVGKSNDALGRSEEDRKLVLEWLDKVESGHLHTDDGLKELDQHLQLRTYIAGGQTWTAADIAVYVTIHNHVATASHDTLLNHVNVTRHFDFIQHKSFSLSSIQSKISTFNLPSRVNIDITKVPTIQYKSLLEKKEKPKKEVTITLQVGDPKAIEAATLVSGGKKEKKLKEKVTNPVGDTDSSKVKEKGSKKAGGSAVDPSANAKPMPHMIDLRIGKIVDINKHPDADSLYVEKVDFGEPEIRIVVSGLVNYIPIEQLQNRLVVGVCNLKPANMRGVKSFAMLLCATSKEGKSGMGSIEVISPPKGSMVGDRVFFQGFENDLPLDQLNPKKKQWETIQPDFITLASKEAAWIDPETKKEHLFVTSKGVCFAETHVGASLS